jgi:VWFA-related protein
MWPVAAQQPTFSARRDTVLVDVLVTDRNRPVRDLKARDFELLDSGVPQTLDLVSFGEFPISVLLALDNSASITSAQLEHLRGAGRAVLANLARDDEAALLTFADAVTLHQSPTANIAAVRDALDAVPATPPAPTGGTALVNAVYAALMLPETANSRRVLIAFTDGVDTSSWLTARRVLETARRSDVVAYAVSTGRMAGGSFARDLSDVTGGKAIEVGSTADLRATFVSILAEFRDRYLLSYSPAHVPDPGWHPLTVRVRGRRLDVKARTGYLK